MSSNARIQTLSLDALTRAWSDIVLNTRPLSRNTSGVDGITVNDFAENPKYYLQSLARAAHRGSFQFDELKPVLIKKPNGNDRLICVPTVRDRVFQRALVNFLADKYHTKLANSISYGFIKDRSVKDAAAIACGARKKNSWVFKTDITSFFDTVDRGILEGVLKTVIRERSLHELLINAVHCEVRPPSSGTSRRRISALGIRAGKGLRQGMPLSPLFSNLLLGAFDNKVVKAAIPAVRYADDLIFFSDSRAECVRIADFCQREFAKINLSIPALESPASKSVIYAPDEPAEFLGLELAPCIQGYELRLSDRQRERIRDDLLCYGSIKELLSRKVSLRTLGSVLVAKRNGYLAAYENCANIASLEADLNDLERKCLLKIYHDELRMDLPKLSAAAHTFLGLGT
jgi:RNA-directed DNA polymerase